MIKFFDNTMVYGVYYEDKEGIIWGDGTEAGAVTTRIHLNEVNIETELEKMGCGAIAKCVPHYSKIKQIEEDLYNLIEREFENPIGCSLGQPWSKIKFITSQIEEVAELLD